MPRLCCSSSHHYSHSNLILDAQTLLLPITVLTHHPSHCPLILHAQALLLPATATAGGGCSEGVVQDGLEGGKLGKALLRRYDDPGEACRELAVGTLSGLMQVRVRTENLALGICVCSSDKGIFIYFSVLSYLG